MLVFMVLLPSADLIGSVGRDLVTCVFAGQSSNAADNTTLRKPPLGILGESLTPRMGSPEMQVQITPGAHHVEVYA
jgi:hypothetical protein